MSTLAFITDTHTGCDGSGFHQQPGRPDLACEIFRGLRDVLHHHKVDLLVHGGDLTERGFEAQIAEALRLHQSLEIPMALCLGNHDVGEANSASLWDEALGGCSWLIAGDSVVSLDDVDVYTVDNNWLTLDGAIERHWQAGSVETLNPRQIAWLDEVLGAENGRPAAVVIHVPLHPLPAEQTGAGCDIHCCDPAYSERLLGVLDRHPRVKLVLSGHNHVNNIAVVNGRTHLTTSSLIEPHFELRLLRFTPNSVRIETVAAMEMPSESPYVAERAWIHGRECDRYCELHW